MLEYDEEITALNNKSEILKLNFLTILNAEEAVYIVLQLHIRKASWQIIFISTSPDNRVELLKPIDDVENMDDDSKEIYISGLLKRYCKRPAKLENLTLADWAAWYDRTEKPYVKQTNEVDVGGLPLETFIDDKKLKIIMLSVQRTLVAKRKSEQKLE